MGRVILMAFACWLFLTGCDNNAAKEKTKGTSKSDDKVEKAYLDKAMQEIEHPEKKGAALLAAKYELGQDKVENIIKDYLSVHDLIASAIYSASDGNATPAPSNIGENEMDTIKRISEKYNVPIKTVNSIRVESLLYTERCLFGILRG